MLDLSIDNIDRIVEDTFFKSCLLTKLKERKKNITIDGFHVYQCSFSLDDDSLCMWNYYTSHDDKAKEPIQGANLKFDMKKINDFIHPDSDYRLKFIYGKVCYDENQQIEIIKQIVDRFLPFYYEHKNEGMFIAAYCVDKISIQGIFFKNIIFR